MAPAAKHFEMTLLLDSCPIEDQNEKSVAGPQAVDLMAGTWWAAYLPSPRSQYAQEQRYAAELATKEIGHYLPLVETTQWRKQVKHHVVKPAFPRYIFVCPADDKQLLDARCSRICPTQFLRVTDQASLVRELSMLQQALSINRRAVSWPYLLPGKLVRVARGPYQGLEGMIEHRTDGRSALHLRVTMMSQSVALEVQASDVELI